jgi:glycosyltransferase involved in cell wall biosynthesis
VEGSLCMGFRKIKRTFFLNSGTLKLAIRLYKKYLHAKNGVNARDLVLWKSQLSKKTVFVDVSSLVLYDHGGGIQRVQRSVVDNWNLYPPEGFDICPVYYSEVERKFLYVNTGQIPNLTILSQPKSRVVEMAPYDIYLNMDLNYRFALENKDFYQLLQKYDIQIFTIIYDLLPLSLPSAFPIGVPELHFNWFNLALRNSKLICISGTVENRVAKWATSYGLSAQTTSITLGSNLLKTSSVAHPIAKKDRVRSRMNFLIVSTIEIRKCHELVLDAFEELWAKRQDITLTFVGRKGWGVDNLLPRIESHRHLNTNLFWHNKLSDEALVSMYSDSVALINASVDEGFGLPLVEASVFGLPLILRDIEIFREVAGEKAWYFATNDAKELAASIESWIKRYSKGDIHPSTEIKTVSWRETCIQIEEVFKLEELI